MSACHAHACIYTRMHRYTHSQTHGTHCSDLTLDWMKIAMLIAGVAGTFVALVYLGNVAYEILGQLDEGCSNERLLSGDTRGYLVRCGVGITFDEAQDSSIVVSSIASESPAANSAVIQVGDILHSVDGRSVHRADLELIARLVPGEEGSNVELGFRRGGAFDSSNTVDGPVYLVVLQRNGGIRTYGAVGSPPRSPQEEVGRQVSWENPEVVVHVHGNSSVLETVEGTHVGAVLVSSATSAAANKNK